MKPAHHGPDDDAVSITTGFIINVGIATIAVSIILFQLQGLYTDMADNSKETELRVVGERMAWELEKADRMVQRGAEGEVYVESDDIEYTYSVDVHDDVLVLQSGSNQVNVTHDVETDVDGTPVGLAGGQTHTVELEDPMEIE